MPLGKGVSTYFSKRLDRGLTADLLEHDDFLVSVDHTALSTPTAMIKGVWPALATNFVIETGYERLDSRFSPWWTAGMLGTVWLIIMAMAIGAGLNILGNWLDSSNPLQNASRSDRSLVVATVSMSISLNITTGDQYMGIVLPGRMFRDLYHERGIAPETLSWEVEETGPITSPMAPWNSRGAYMETVAAYLSFWFFNLISVALSFIYTLYSFQVTHVEPGTVQAESTEKVVLYSVGKQRAEPATQEAAHPA